MFRVLVSFSIIISTFFINNYKTRAQSFLPESGKTPEFLAKNELLVSVKPLSVEEEVRFLKKNLQRKGFQTLLITIDNHGKNSYGLDASQIETPHVSHNQVCIKCAMSGIPRSIALKVGGFFFWPLIIPSTVDSIISYQSHRLLKKDYYSKSIKEEGELILPYSTVQRVVFISKKNLSKELVFTMKNQQDGKLVTIEVPIDN